MAAGCDWDLRDVVHHLAVTHARAAALYDEMAAVPGTAASVRLLAFLARRERRLERASAALARRIDTGFRVRQPTFELDTPAPLPARVDAEAVISRAVHVEAAVEKLLQAAAAPPVAAPAIVAELVALHQRELFDLGVAASRLRETLE